MSELKTNKISTNDQNNVAIDNALGLKSYTTAQRDALTSVAGDMIYNSDDNKVQYYNGTEWLSTDPVVGELEYLVIAGGGGGATAWSSSIRAGGGGGAGGYRCSVEGERSGGNTDPEDKFIIETSTNYTVTVGAGGAGGSGGYFGDGTKGNDSVFATITSLGGGASGDGSSTLNDGGSGGGAAYNEGEGTGTNNQGCDGGTRRTVNGSTYAAGGGGAKRAGNDGGYPNATTVYGGFGLSSSITGSAVTRGKGGNSPGGAGDANEGDGGGGSGSTSASAGGSGIVVLRYPNTYTITVGAGLTNGGEQTDGSDKYIVFTAGTGTISFS